MKIVSPRLIVSDIKKTLAFYLDTLGFKAIGIFPDEEHPAWATVLYEESDIDHFTLMFLDYPQMDEGSYAYQPELDKAQKGLGINFYFNITGVDELYKRITEGGIKTFIHDIETMPYGLREFTIADPDGYQLTFCEEVQIDSCLSCGMPMNKIELRGAQKPDNSHCVYCTDEKGALLSREAVEKKMIAYLIESGAPEDQAHKLAQDLMAQQPAWK